MYKNVVPFLWSRLYQESWEWWTKILTQKWVILTQNTIIYISIYPVSDSIIFHCSVMSHLWRHQRWRFNDLWLKSGYLMNNCSVMWWCQSHLVCILISENFQLSWESRKSMRKVISVTELNWKETDTWLTMTDLILWRLILSLE